MAVGALAAIFGTSFLVSLSGALSPGPLSTMAVREGARQGFWAGPTLAFGHGVLELAMVIGLAVGLSQVLDNDAVAATVAALGGAFLLVLGVRTVGGAPRQELRVGAGDGPEAVAPPRHPFHAVPPKLAAVLAAFGVVVSISNPFWVVWWATIGSAYVGEALDQGAAGVASFYSGHVLADLGWLSLIAFVLATGRRLIGRQVYQGILALCGVFLIGLGGWFLWSAVGYATS